MSATMTVTGKAGPGDTVTAQVFTDVRAWRQDCINNVLSIEKSDGRIIDITIDAASTYTVTKTADTATYVVTIS